MRGRGAGAMRSGWGAGAGGEGGAEPRWRRLSVRPVHMPLARTHTHHTETLRAQARYFCHLWRRVSVEYAQYALR